MASDPDISVKMGSIELSNPVIAASGTFGYGLEFVPFLDLNRLGGLCTKGLSLKPRLGNPVPRVFETASGMLNAIGLENVGLERFRDEKLPLLQKYKTCIIANFFGETVQEYVEMAGRLSSLERIDALEMNISCPNAQCGGRRPCFQLESANCGAGGEGGASRHSKVSNREAVSQCD